MNSKSVLEYISNDLKLMIIVDKFESNNSLIEAVKLFFTNEDNITLVNSSDVTYVNDVYDLIIHITNFTSRLDVFENIKKSNKDQELLVLTDAINSEIIFKLLAMGINNIITLPLDSNEFEHRVLKACENVYYKKYYEVENSVLSTANINKVFPQDTFSSSMFGDYLNINNISEKKFELMTKNLIDLNSKFNRCFEKVYINGFNQILLENITEILKDIVDEFKQLENLKKLSSVINDLVVFLKDLRICYLDTCQVNKLRIIEFIYDDISRYINTVFVFRNTVDIYYLQDSLSTSIIQLKQRMYNTELAEVELEIF